MPARRDAAFLLACLAAVPAFADPAAHDRALAAFCSSCHSLRGATSGIPSVAGMQETQIEQSLLAYRNRQRSSQIMQVVAASLTPDEIAEVSRYLGSQKREAAP